MKFLAYLISYICYPFSFLFIRRKNRVSFGSYRNTFADNAKYLFIYCQKQRKDIDSAWLSLSVGTIQAVRSLGLTAYFTLSPKGLWYALTSKYWFYNSYSSDIMFGLSGGAICVNLWHGVGLKRTEFNITSGTLADRYVRKKFRERFYHPEAFKRPDWLLTSTPFQTHMFASAFRIDQSHCLELGYPRNELLTSPNNVIQCHINLYEGDSTKKTVSLIKDNKYTKVYIYMPTWRDSQREIFVQSFDLAKMNALLQEQNSLLLLKPHSNTIVDIDALQHNSNIILIDGKTDIYPILPYTDVLITDYSSILYDYILMDNKDVILYLYDYEEYVKDRDFYYPFEENVVGKWVTNFEQLCNCIKQQEYAIDFAKKKEILEKFWGNTVAVDSNNAILSFFFSK